MKVKKILSDEQLFNVIDAFATMHMYVGALPYGNGHINDTFVAHFQPEEGCCKRYIIQRINTKIFKEPIKLMENIIGVTDYVKEMVIKNGGDPLRESLSVVRTKKGEICHLDEDGGYWRCYDFVENTISLQQAETAHDFYNCARAFGNFQRMLADFPAASLHHTIKDFHDTKVRYVTFTNAVNEDVSKRANTVADEIKFCDDRKDFMSTLVDLLNDGKLPLRVTHNDTKLNNVLMDAKTHEGVCVVDLDTVMPGLSVYDFGDSIRSGATTGAEDEKDLSKVNLSLELFESYTKGFMETAGEALTQTEIEMLPTGAKMMTLECGMRFLTDYLQGDVYFKTAYDTHNLDRARTQFKLVSDMEENWDKMHEIVSKYCK